MSYHLGQVPPPETSLPSDVAPSLLHELDPKRERGWVAVPTVDMREYVKTQLITMAAGFIVGVSVGAVLGNIFSGKKVSARELIPNERRRTTKRRSSARGRKTVRPVPSDEMTLKMGGASVHVTIDRGFVTADGQGVGTIYDGYSFFRAVPWTSAEPRDFERLADGVKYLVRTKSMTKNGATIDPRSGVVIETSSRPLKIGVPRIIKARDPEDGTLIGELRLRSSRGGFAVEWVEVDYTRRGKFVAQALYQRAAELACAQGLTIRSDSTRSDAADAWWKKQVRAGHAVAVAGRGTRYHADTGRAKGRLDTKHYELLCPPRQLANNGMKRNARHAPPITKAEAVRFVKEYGADEAKWAAEAWRAAKQDNYGKAPRLSSRGWYRNQIKDAASRLVFGYFKHPAQTEPVEFADDYWDRDQVIEQVMLVLHDMARKGNR